MVRRRFGCPNPHKTLDGTSGAYFSAFYRMPTYTLGVNDPSYQTATTIKGGAIRSNYTWGGVKTVKMYDRGACSFVVPWRTLLNEIATTVEAKLASSSTNLVALDLGSRASLTPLLRTAATGEDQGAFEFVEAVVAHGSKFGLSGEVRVLLRLVVSVGMSNGTLTATIVKFDLEKTASNVWVDLADSLGIVNTDAILSAARSKISALLSTQLNQSLSAAGMLTRRVNWRPEGIEFIVAEESTDAVFPAAKAFGMCNRAAWSPVTSFFTGVFDPPLASDPEVYRDTKDASQRLVITPTSMQGILKD